MGRRLLKLGVLSALAVTLFAAGASAARAGPRAQAGPYQVEVTTDPAVIPVGRARLILEITDREGKPVTGADARAIAEMPGMPMGEREEAAVPQPGQPGVYVVPAQFPMAGGYVATVRIAGPLGAGTAKIPRWRMRSRTSTPASRAGLPGCRSMRATGSKRDSSWRGWTRARWSRRSRSGVPASA